ncbi:MAG: TetR/AcrR family transcriptional regulator [Castellaniella sp.]|uniref:TetR/AcrR family transcriptional regulator n=1 Tax=Castellaniella sp. TaxID=1955812 RepID=UPI0012211C85|nr:TetR/AcrR family transcriptional regulator [Castellaniella sp.]TAN27924.1 MAG: TetR/AcrR family transcriptional regulator [Castellaniella sp.]
MTKLQRTETRPTGQGREPKAKPARAADRIRRSARDLFYHQGIRAVGVDAIVADAGVTKPSLYRTFASKDDLAAAYLRDYEVEFWRRFDAAVNEHPGDPRAQILAYFTGLAKRTSLPGYRGCGLTNACVEYPDPDHPARRVSIANKQKVRERLADMARQMGARDPDGLGDGLQLLLEGAYTSSQILGANGPVRHLAAVAARLIDASLA